MSWWTISAEEREEMKQEMETENPAIVLLEHYANQEEK